MKTYKYKRIATMLSVMLVCSFLLPANTFATSQSTTNGKITASVKNRNTVSLKWNKVKNAAKYKVYRKAGDGKYVLVKTTAKRTYQSKALAYSKKYTFKVTALSTKGKALSSQTRVVYTQKKEPSKQQLASSITLEQVMAQNAEQQEQTLHPGEFILPDGKLHIMYRRFGCAACTPGFTMFGVYKDISCTEVVETGKVDLHNSVIIHLPEGTYYFREVQVPEGYTLDTTIYAVSVQAGKETTIVTK